MLYNIYVVALRQIHWYHFKISNHVINSLSCLQRIEHAGRGGEGGVRISISLVHLRYWETIYMYICVHTSSMRFATLRMYSTLNKHGFFIFHLISLIRFHHHRHHHVNSISIGCIVWKWEKKTRSTTDNYLPFQMTEWAFRIVCSYCNFQNIECMPHWTDELMFWQAVMRKFW